MKGPPRLLGGGSSLEQSLLRSGLDEQPSSDLESRILAAVAAAPAAASLEDPGASGARPAVSGFFRSRRLLVAVAALGVSALLVGTMVIRNEPIHAGPAASPVSPTPLVAVAPAAPAPAAVDRPEVVLTPDSLPTAPAPSVVRPSNTTALSASAKPSTLTDDGPSLEREVMMLDAVKKKLGAGAGGATDASVALDAYDAEFPQGALRPEATVLRVRTLLLQGNRAAATKLADEFLAKHPGSVHGKRIRALLAE